MPFHPAPLEDPWRAPFRVSDAMAAGVGEGRLRRLDLERPFRGARSPRGATPTEGYLPLLRNGERFSHTTTAAALLGAPLPRRVDGEVHVLIGPDDTRARTSGVIGHRGRGTRMLHRGMPVSKPVDLVVELATVLSLDELVAVIDFLALSPRFRRPSDPRPFVEFGELRGALAQRSGRGIRRAREAAGLARPGVESPKETELRLIAVRAGLPEPECGAEIFDSRGRIGWFDLAWLPWRILSEYDGDQHRTSTLQYDRDIARFDRAAAAEFRVIRVRSSGLHHPGETRSRLLAAFHAAGWRP